MQWPSEPAATPRAQTNPAPRAALPVSEPRPLRSCAQLCEYIMANSVKQTLLVCTFQTLLKFLNWIPLGYIFEVSARAVCLRGV